MSLNELAQEFVGWSRFNITESDLELLEEMPDDIYRKKSHELQRRIEKVIRELEKGY